MTNQQIIHRLYLLLTLCLGTTPLRADGPNSPLPAVQQKAQDGTRSIEVIDVPQDKELIEMSRGASLLLRLHTPTKNTCRYSSSFRPSKRGNYGATSPTSVATPVMAGSIQMSMLRFCYISSMRHMNLLTANSGRFMNASRHSCWFMQKQEAVSTSSWEEAIALNIDHGCDRLGFSVPGDMRV